MNDDTAIPSTSYAAASTSATDMAQSGRRPRQPDYCAPEPRIFSEKTDEDVDAWLKHFDRDIFVKELKACFGDTSSMKKKAEQTLSRRAQLPGETCTIYIEEVLKLCGMVNANMSHENKVGHLLKGIAEDVYNFLITKENLNTPSIFRQQCRAFEAFKTRRILPKFGHLDNVPKYGRRHLRRHFLPRTSGSLRRAHTTSSRWRSPPMLVRRVPRTTSLLDARASRRKPTTHRNCRFYPAASVFPDGSWPLPDVIISTCRCGPPTVVNQAPARRLLCVITKCSCGARPVSAYFCHLCSC
ncbi:hypothetical protein HPB51_010358 [Rhipicephalus microplus]|uniref:Retrotransposon gag domain-containing protein n=1 Tax=Rhipicephalus microplus TaxID=6941 RepID=A0A9J6E100_RHIMP|nr:hypothetical protein HPB51_010358 [Rhipicephalus microplus]